MTSGMALVYTLDIDSSKARYVGAEILLGFAVGFGNQIPMMAVQGWSRPEDMASSTGIMLSEYILPLVGSNLSFVAANAGISGPIWQCSLFHRRGSVDLCQPHVSHTQDHCP